MDQNTEIQQFIHYLENILGNDNNLRAQSEQVLVQVRKAKPDQFILMLLNLIKSSHPPKFIIILLIDCQKSQIRHLSSIILKNNISKFSRGDTFIYLMLVK